MFIRIFVAYIFFFLISCSISEYRTPASNQKKHIVFDLDGTLIYNVSKDLMGQKDVYQIKDEYYKLAPHSREFIEHLLLRDDVEISFFSGGSKERNDAILKKIKLSDSRSFYEIAFKHLDKEDLEVNDKFDPESMPDKFAYRYNKNLLSVSENLDNIILIDDGRHWLPQGQEDNLFYIFDGQWYFTNYSAAKSALRRNPKKKYMPHTLVEYELEQKKFFWISSIVERVLNGEEGSLKQRLQKELRDSNGNLVHRSDEFFKRDYKLGRNLISTKKSCSEAFNKLIGVY